jgi:hypothetical protein
VSLFGNSSKKNESITDNTLQNAQQTNNQGNLNNGDGAVTYTSTDHGAVAGGVAVTQAALAANIESTRLALDATATVNINALDTVTGFGESVIDKLNTLSTTVLVNGEKATRGALALAKSATTSEAADISKLMLKAGLIIGTIAIVGAVVVRGGKK